MKIFKKKEYMKQWNEEKKWGSAHCSIWKSNLYIETIPKDMYRMKKELSNIDWIVLKPKKEKRNIKNDKWIVKIEN